MTILEAEGIRNVAVLKKTDSYVAAELVTTRGKRESRTSVKKVRGAPLMDRFETKDWSGPTCRPMLVLVLVLELGLGQSVSSRQGALQTQQLLSCFLLQA